VRWSRLPALKPEGPVPGCAAEDMAVPLAFKDLRPLRGAFAVFDREPPARHRQNGAACQGGLPQHAPRRPQAPKGLAALRGQ